MNWRRRRGGQETELEKELRFHIEERVRDLVKSGMTEEEARRWVRQEFGGMEQVREQCLDIRPGRWMERAAEDFKYAVRGVRKRPGSALTIVLTVAVCVAVNTAVFTVVDSLLLRPLPFEGADRLIAMSNQYPKAGISDQDASAAGDYIDRDGTLPAVAEQALYRFITHPVDRGGVPHQMKGAAVSPSFFPLLRVRPARGRLFTDAESEPGKHRTVILTDALWREAFGGAEAIGQDLRISGQSYRVAGVLPPGFRFIAADVRYFVPLALNAEEKRVRHSNNHRYVARLREGATVAQAQAQVDALNAQLLDQFPAFKELLINAGFFTRVDELQPWLMRHVRPNLQLLWIGALLVLIVGAVNVAGLSLARANSRKREMATRIALGATRGDVIRQCLIEGIVPAMIGGVVGMAGGLILLRALDRELLPGSAEIKPEALVAVYALCGALLAGVLAGLASLVPVRGLELARAMHDGSRGGTTRSVNLRRAFVVAQVALAFVLLNGAGLLTASIRELWRVDPGFQVTDVWTASTYLPTANYTQASDLRLTMDRITERVRGVAGVQVAGGGSAVPFLTDYDDNVVFAEGYTMKPGESAISPVRLYVTPGYVETFGVGVVHGRLIDGRDRNDSARVVLVDERLAKRFWPGENPVGRRMYYPTPGAAPTNWMTVVGVVRSIRLEDLSGAGNPNGIYYIPWSQGPSRALSIVWRGPSETVAAVRSEFARVVPGAALFDVRSMTERQEMTLAARRTAQTLVLVFAGVAVLLTAVGVNGLLAFLVTQRRREIGIRLAIGCRPVGVYGLFLREGFVLVAVGLVVGLGGAALLRSWVANQLYGVGAMEPAVLVVVLALIAAVSMMAISFPAWRAARVDPVSVLGEG